jgi:hypothetical protein
VICFLVRLAGTPAAMKNEIKPSPEFELASLLAAQKPIIATWRVYVAQRLWTAEATATWTSMERA